VKILIALATFNRPIITDLCLKNIQLVRDGQTKVVVYDDCSEAYSSEYLGKYADEVIRFNSRGGIEKSRATAFREFLKKYSEFDLLYLTDNDAIHDPGFSQKLREIFHHQEKSNIPIKPVGLFNSVFHQNRINGEMQDCYLYETCPGISMCFTRPMVEKIVDFLEKNPLITSSYGWDMEWPKVLELPFLIPKVSYVEHFARDRFESGMHSGNSGVALENAMADFERDRAINPSKYLIEIRPKIIKEILGDWTPLHEKISTLISNALKSIQKKQFGLARGLLLQARELNPGDPNALRFLSVVSALQFDYENALNLIDETIRLAPQYAIAHSNRGNILKELGRFEEALASANRAIQLDPTYVEGYLNKGNILQQLTRYEDALTLFDKAITLQSNYAEAYSNKGNALVLLGRYQDAMNCFDRATAINPQYIDAYWHKAMTQLLNGDYERGWQNYEARWFKTHNLQLQHMGIQRLENIQSVPGKKILIWAEQGLGDTLQFCRYIKLLSDAGASQIIFSVPAALLDVLSPLKKFCILMSSEAKIEGLQVDFQSPLLSLPLLFGTTLESIPASIPYLDSDPLKKDNFQKFLGVSPLLKVGLIWNGGFRADAPELWQINRRRNIEFDQMAALKDVPGVDFYSLQKGDPAESELRSRKDKAWPNLINCVDLLNDFSDTAALMECLDLIISVDTSSAHLAGALGKPVWILNRFDSCWRWLRDRGDSPWYPTAKIYQQKTPGDWEGVIARVKVDLTALVKDKYAHLGV
jgi:tetratricopeptide (TPR) repeat protein